MKTPRIASGVLVSALLALAAAPAAADGVLQFRVDGPELRVSYALPLGHDTEFGLDRVRLRLGGLRVFESDLDGNMRSGLGDWSLLGDYYFGKQRRFRATGGVLRGERPRDDTLEAGLGREPSHWASSGMRAQPTLQLDARSQALPYIGMGYSEPTFNGSNWNFFADVGMVMLKPRSSVKLGAASGGSWLSYDPARRDGEMDLPRALGDWRLSPVIQFGLSYSF